MAEDREKFLQAEQERIGYYKFNNGLILGSLKAKLMNANTIQEFNNLLSGIQSNCDGCSIPVSRVINDELLATKKKELTQ